MGKAIYLDNAATTPLCEGVLEEVNEYLASSFYNPSSAYATHYLEQIDETRELIAELINAESPKQIFFTSGASEGNSWALSQFDKVITSRLEHDSILLNDTSLVFADHDKNGSVDTKAFEHLCRQGADAAEVMLVNNELGIIQPIRALTNIAHTYGMYMITDATQAVGHIPVNVGTLDVDWLNASGHKFGACKGIGFTYIREPYNFKPLIYGTQNLKYRGGTYNMPGIISMNIAVRHLLKHGLYESYRVGTLRTYLRMQLGKYQIFTENCKTASKAPHVMSFQVDGIKSEELVEYLALHDIYVSSGSACNSASGEPSHVLMGVGLSEVEAGRTIRVSFNAKNTIEEIDELLERILEFREMKK